MQCTKPDCRHRAKDRAKTLQDEQAKAQAEEAQSVPQGANDEEIAIDDDDV